MRDRSDVIFFSVLWLLSGCGAGSAGQAVRPDDPTAGGALGEGDVTCTNGLPQATPLVVDWKTNDQLELTVAMQNGVALVAYDCKSIRLVKGCSVAGGYKFTAIPSVLQEAVQIADADEVKASLPFSGGTLGGEVARGASIDIGLAYVGKRATGKLTVEKAELKGGECDQVTHFVRGASVGAFAMATGTKGEVRAAADIFGVGASGASSSSKKKLNSAGDLNACKSITGAATSPPDACAAVVRLELAQIAGGAAGAADAPIPPPLANTCPEGFVPSNGRCAKKGAAGGYRCDSKNEAECKEQCGKGNVESCYNAGIVVVTGAAVDGPEVNEGVTLYTKACDGGVGDACTRLSHLYWYSPLFKTSPKEILKAGTSAKKGCDLLVPQACELQAQRDQTISIAERFALHQRACNLGFQPACIEVANYLLVGKEGVPENVPEALRILGSMCDAADKKACERLISVYKNGKPEVKDPAKAEETKKRACERGVKLFGCK
jgi:hypothetical protein